MHIKQNGEIVEGSKVMGRLTAARGETIDTNGTKRATDGVKLESANGKNFIIITSDGIRIQTSGGAMVGLWGNTVHIEGRVEKA